MGYSKNRSGQGNIRRNAAQGKRAESQVRAKLKRQGYSVVRTGTGHDFKATKRRPFRTQNNQVRRGKVWRRNAVHYTAEGKKQGSATSTRWNAVSTGKSRARARRSAKK